MAVIVDPAGFDPHHRGHKGRHKLFSGRFGHAPTVADFSPRMQATHDAGLGLDGLGLHGLTCAAAAATLRIMALVEAPERTKQERKAADTVIAALAARYGNRLATAAAVREQHGHTTTWIDNQPPDAVVFPQSTEEGQEVVRLCASHRVPVIAFGTGTSLEGQVNAPRGGICLDFRDMNRVLAVHAEDLDCVIEPGITRKALNEHL